MKQRTGKELLWFFAMANVISWLFWLPSFLKAARIGLPLPEELLVKLGDFMPSVVAIFLTAVTFGRAGLAKIFNSIVNISFGLPWCLYTFLLMPGILAVAYLFSHIAAGLKFNSILASIILPQIWPVLLLILYFVIMQGPLGEELGWRGYALPRLFEIFNPMQSSLILGLIWSVWHFPKFFMEGTTQYSIALAYGIGTALAGYTLYTILLTFMMTLLFIKTRGSVLAAILFHAMSNFSHGLITILTNPAGGLSILLVMLVVTGILILRFRKEFFFDTECSLVEIIY